MSETTKYLQLENDIVKALKQVYDPEIPVNIYDLGLIYRIEVDDNNNVEIDMTLTAPNCPIADSMVNDAVQSVKSVPTVNEVNLKLTFDPPWDASMMTEEAKLEMGFL